MSLSVTIIGADGTSHVQTFVGDRLSIQGITFKVESDPSISPPVIIPPPVIVPIPLTITTISSKVTSTFTVTGTGPIGTTVQLADVFTAPVIPPIVTPPPSAAGIWTNVTPIGINLDPNSLISGGQPFNFGAQDVVSDPKNPGTLITSFTYQGVWRSKDYGLTWTKLSNNGILVPIATIPASSDPMDNGRSSMVIAPDGSRIVSTLLYPINGASNGCWISKATDVGGLGASWRRVDISGVPNGGDIGSFDFDPGNPLHVVCFSHSPSASFWESIDGGETWKPQPLPLGAPVKIRFVSPGHLMAGWDWGSNVNPQIGTVTGGTWTWLPTTAKDEKGNVVAGQTSFHGAQQVFYDALNDATFIGGPEGVQRSSDIGRLNWVKLATPNTLSSGIVATAKNIYSTSNFASGAGFQQNFMFGPRNSLSGSTWKSANVPIGMNNGWDSAAVVNDGTHSILVAGCWNAGLWRYVEP